MVCKARREILCDCIVFAGNFAINSATGVLTVAGDLDHENITQYTLDVQAREDIGDRTTTPDTVSCSLTGYCTHIMDGCDTCIVTSV